MSRNGPEGGQKEALHKTSLKPLIQFWSILVQNQATSAPPCRRDGMQALTGSGGRNCSRSSTIGRPRIPPIAHRCNMKDERILGIMHFLLVNESNSQEQASVDHE